MTPRATLPPVPGGLAGRLPYVDESEITVRLDGMNVYLSGPMTGIDQLNAPAFRDAERRCLAAGASYVYDPCENGSANYDPDLMTHEEAMALSARVLLEPGAYQVAVTRPGCVPHPMFDVVVCLPGSEASSGAEFEVTVARMCGIDVVDLSDVDGAMVA